MSRFKSFFLSLSMRQRVNFALSVGTTKAYLTHVAHGKPVSLGMALAIAVTANAEGSDVRVDDFLLTADGRKHYSAAVSALRRMHRSKSRARSPQQLPAGDCLADLMSHQVAQQGAQVVTN